MLSSIHSVNIELGTQLLITPDPSTIRGNSMFTQSITTTEAQAMLDNACCCKASSSADNYLSWTEKLEGAAWSVGFSLAGILVVIVMAPIKLFALLVH